MEVRTLDWGEDPNHKGQRLIYTFRGKRMDKRAGIKQVYKGYFIGSAPENLHIDRLYILKIIHLGQCGTRNGLPATREQYETLDYGGDHIREILARDETACRVEEQLRESAEFTERGMCYVIEPCYVPLEGLVPYLDDTSFYERLEMTRQIALGAKEMTSTQIGNWKIDAHRDIKISNCMIERALNDFLMRLIDPPTVHMTWNVGAMPPDGSLDHTFDPNMVSPSNTTPEDMGLFGWKVSEKTDCYALGQMLAAFFIREHKTPSFLLWEKLMRTARPGEEQCEVAKERLAEIFEKYKDHDPSHPNWLEDTLGTKLAWIDAESDFIEPIKRLYLEATEIDPEKRVSMDEFISRLDALIESDAVPHQRTASPYLYHEKKPQDMVLISTSGLDQGRELIEERLQEMLMSEESGELSLYSGSNFSCDAPGELKWLGTFDRHMANEMQAVLEGLEETDEDPISLGDMMLQLLERMILINPDIGEMSGEFHLMVPGTYRETKWVGGTNYENVTDEAGKIEDFHLTTTLHSFTEPEHRWWYDDWEEFSYAEGNGFRPNPGPNRTKPSKDDKKKNAPRGRRIYVIEPTGVTYLN